MDIVKRRKALYQDLKKADLYGFGVGYVQEIKYIFSEESRPYITWKGSRKYLENFIRFNTPWSGDNKDIIGNPSAFSDDGQYFIVIDNNGESAFIYWYITK